MESKKVFEVVWDGEEAKAKVSRYYKKMNPTEKKDMCNDIRAFLNAVDDHSNIEISKLRESAN